MSVAIQYNDINVYVINLLSNKPQILSEEIDGIMYWYFPAPLKEQRTIDKEKQEKLYFRNVVHLLKLHIIDKNDLIFHLNYSQGIILAEELKKAFSCKVIYSVHYLDWCIGLCGNVTHLRKILTTAVTNLLDELEKAVFESFRKDKEFFGTVDHIICLSKNTQQILYNDYQINPDKVSLIFNGVNDINPVKDKIALRNKYHIPDIPVILFVGRLDELKGLTFALRAFKTVLRSYSHCHFIVAGDGAFNDRVKECEDIWMHVTWTGLINKEKVYDLYSIADIGIIPSFMEQCCYVAIEMMMFGLPIVTTAAQGLAEMTENGISSLQVPIKEHLNMVEISPDMLADKILYLLEHTEEAKRIGMNARKRYEERYSGKLFKKNILDFYHSLYE